MPDATSFRQCKKYFDFFEKKYLTKEGRGGIISKLSGERRSTESENKDNQRLQGGF